MSVEINAILTEFDTLAAETVPRWLPVGGTSYRYTWVDDSRSNDWVSDGYRWRNQGADKKMKRSKAVEVWKTYFHVCMLRVSYVSMRRIRICKYKMLHYWSQADI
jgi:nitrate reductase gamma subunit